jgi:hypothetical protein
MDRKYSRRSVLRRGLQFPVGAGLTLGLVACGSDSGDALVCADPNSMTSAQESVRRTLKYVELSDDPARVCAGCEFFTAPPGGAGCGACAMFSGEAVNPVGRCDSWSVDS